ncbi:MAG: hypothetical protein Ct9H300mP6_05510 [Gammaproteobacteria bacterium]|nr:MAG: hypothetical protein Ct9H300mP6_05510 [Gammaproteobacteria bacterium]
MKLLKKKKAGKKRMKQFGSVEIPQGNLSIHYAKRRFKKVIINS